MSVFHQHKKSDYENQHETDRTRTSDSLGFKNESVMSLLLVLMKWENRTHAASHFLFIPGRDLSPVP